MQHGSVCIQYAHKSRWNTLKLFIVTTEGPTIIRLPSFRNLELISHHCTIEEDKGLINPIVDLTHSYPNQFDGIGHFIVLKPDHHLVIHAPRKCPIHLRDEIEEELKTVESQGIIRPNGLAALCTFKRRMENFAYVYTQRIWTERSWDAIIRLLQWRSWHTSCQVLKTSQN